MNLFRHITLEELSHPISSHVMPIFAFKGRACIIGGTAVSIAPHLAMTAKHVIEYIFARFNLDIKKQTVVSIDIYIHQVATGCTWYVSQIFAWVGTDIVILRLCPRTECAKNFIINRLPMTIDPPVEGSEITALGYPASKMALKQNDSKVTKIKLDVHPTVSVGRVLQIYRSYRDSSMLNFPCFSVDARFSAGMSGGAVFNEKKKLCGLICTGVESNPETNIQYSNVVSIWPSAIIPLTFASGGLHPPGLEIGKEYKLLDLAKIGYLDLEGHERIEFFTHENGTAGVRRKHY